ncbi:hypothetical protein [Parasitella parasitica]|uniref:DNA helicase Pif1-like 2B domain-containing protein n=1 Tax=Parasitella parasitica TaxID=35722 RepID=A0A0B7NW64_9FUNG|nr:hypothetical protein [Parasitella parasitica]
MHGPVDLLNSVESGSLPLHELVLRIGAAIILLRNLNPAVVLCDDTSLIVRSRRKNILEATIVTGPNAGNDLYLGM